MKKKILSFLLTLVLVLSFSLVTGAPVAAQETLQVVPFDLEKGGDGDEVAEWSDSEYHDGSLSVFLATGPGSGDEARIVINASDVGVATLSDLASISWYEYNVAGYPPHVDVKIDTTGDESADDALVIEYAYNGHIGEGQPTYGALTAAWYQTFGDDTLGPDVIDDTAYAWLTTGPAGGPDIVGGTLAEFKAGTVDASSIGKTVDGSTAVISFEIEVDNWMTASAAYVDDIEINGVTYYGSIQDAIDDASPLDTINVAAGTYNERVDINKSLMLEGANVGIPGSGTRGPESIINPQWLEIFDGDTGKDFGVLIYGADTIATFDGFTVENYHRVGILAGSFSLVEEDPAVVHILNNIVSEPIGQHNNNCIQVGDETTGTIIGNEIFGAVLESPDWSGSGILVAGSSDVLVSENYVHDCEGGIQILGYPDDPAENNFVENNLVEANESGIVAQQNSIGTIIRYNDALNNASGIVSVGYIGWADYLPSGTQIHFNNIVGNINYGVRSYAWDGESNEIELVDATNNWWGDATGPKQATTNHCASGDEVSNNVEYKAWLDAVYPDGSQRGHNIDNITKGSTHRCIHEAIDYASSGDTINVAAGVYDLTAPIVVDKSVTLTGDVTTPSNVIVDATMAGDDRDGFQVKASGVTIQGFKIQGAQDAGSQNCGVVIGTHWVGEPIAGLESIDISHNEFVDCSKGIFMWQVKDSTVTYNTFTTTEGETTDNFADTTGWGGDAVHVYLSVASDYPTGNTISHNTMDNVRVGVFLNGDTISGTDPSAWDFSGTTIEDNTMTDVWNAGIVLQCASGTAESPITINLNDIDTSTGRRTGDEGNERGLISVKGDYTVIDGNTLMYSDGHGLWVDGSHHTVTGNDLTSNASDGIHVGWYKETEPNNGWTLPEITRSDITIQTNTVENVGADAAAISGKSIDSIDILGNTVTDFVKGGIVVSDVLSVQIEGNIVSTTLHSAAPNGIQVGYVIDSTVTTGAITDNQVSGCSWDGYDPLTETYEDDWTGSGILVIAPYSVLEISGNEVQSCDVALDIETGILTLITDNNVHGNSYGFVSWNAFPTISFNNIYQNALGGVYRTTDGDPTGDLDATSNWWGHASGPIHVGTNPLGTGNAVSDKVVYDPWITGDVEPGTVDSVGIIGTDPDEKTLQDSEGETIAVVDISGADAAAEGTITAARYTEEPEEETSLSVAKGMEGVVFVDVRVTGYTSGTAHIIVPYPDSNQDFVVDGTNIDEMSLGLYYWDDSSFIIQPIWRIADNNFVNPDENTVSGDIPVSALTGTPIALGGLPPPPPPPPAPPAPPPGTTDVRGIVTTAGVFQTSVTATSEDELCTLTIPEGTVGLTEELEPLDEITVVIMDEPPPPPEDAHMVGLAYDLGPDGATFDPPITLTFSYDPDALPEGVAEEDLVLAYYDEEAGEWVELVGVVDTENNTITASVPHFTTFAVIGVVPVVAPPAPTPPAPAAFTVSSLGVSPSELAPGEEVNISVLVANTGGKSGSYTVVLKIDGVKEAEERVTVAAGRSQSVSFTVTKEEADTYAVTVDGLSSSFAVVSVVVPPAPAAFSVSYLSVSPRLEVEPGETVAITVMVANTGGKSGSYIVVLKIDGVKEAEETVTVAAGESQDVSFSVTREEADSYAVAVDGLSGSFTVVAPPEEEEEEVLVKPGVNWPLNGSIIGGVVILIGLLIYFLVFRRRAY